MPTIIEQAPRRIKNETLNQIIRIFVIAFSSFMVVGRLICGVHWFTDIVGSLLLCAGLFSLYQAAVIAIYKKENL